MADNSFVIIAYSGTSTMYVGTSHNSIAAPEKLRQSADTINLISHRELCLSDARIVRRSQLLRHDLNTGGGGGGRGGQSVNSITRNGVSFTWCHTPSGTSYSYTIFIELIVYLVIELQPKSSPLTENP